MLSPIPQFCGSHLCLPVIPMWAVGRINGIDLVKAGWLGAEFQIKGTK